MNKNDQKFIVEKIRTQYMEKGPSEIDELKALDSKVKRPVNIFAYLFGTISALIMGSGMSLVMTDIGSKVGISDSMTIGIVLGIIGMVMAIVNYPIHKRMLDSRRKKYANQIMKLSDKILN